MSGESREARLRATLQGIIDVLQGVSPKQAVNAAAEAWALARGAMNLLAAPSPVGEQTEQRTGNHYGAPLTVAVADGAVVIRIGVQTLAHAVTYSEWANPWRDIEDHDYGGRLKALKAGVTPEPERCEWRTSKDGSFVDSDDHRQWFRPEVVREWSHCPYCGKPLSVQPAAEKE